MPEPVRLLVPRFKGPSRLAMLSLRLLAALSLAVLAICAPANAAQRPKLNLMLPPAGGDTGVPTPFSWSVQHKRPGIVVVQRQVGTLGNWRTIATLRGSSGTGTIPALPLGSYSLRIANLGPRIKHTRRYRQWGRQLRELRIFGRVELGTLMHDESSGVLSTPTNTFVWIDWTSPKPTPGEVFGFPINYCRSVHIDFVTNNENDARNRPATTGTVTILQETADPVSVTAAEGVIAGVDADLVPGKGWSMTVSEAGDEYSVMLYYNGWASCYRTADSPVA